MEKNIVQKEKTSEKNLGNLNSLKINITEPLPMDMDIEMNKLSLFVGPNGSGKTLILLLNWVMGIIAGYVVKLKEEKMYKALAQYTFNHSFDNQNFNGTILARFERGIITVMIEKGEVKQVIDNVDTGVTAAALPVFMSKTLRTFDQVKSYLKTEDLVKPNHDKILDFYKLYDVTYIEILKEGLKNEYVVSEKFKKTMKEYDLDKYDIQSIQIKNLDIIFKNSKGTERSLATLSSGEQSLINMFLTSEISNLN